MIKVAFIRKMPGGKYRVVSRKGKNLGEYDTKEEATKRLQQVEFFKHQNHSDDHNSADDMKPIDLTEIDDFTYSAIMRKLRPQATTLQTKQFLQLFKKEFDRAVKKKLQKPEKIALQNSLIKFNKIVPIVLKQKLVKQAGTTELGNAEEVGKYMSHMVKFILNRISPENRSKSIQNLKNKLSKLDFNEIASKDMPASSALGQCITFVKHTLFNHDASYIKEVVMNLINHL